MASDERARRIFFFFVASLYILAGVLAVLVYRSMKHHFISPSAEQSAFASPSSESSQPDPEPLHILVDSPFLYALNPKHGEINSQGLRDDEVIVPKPRNTFRILILGDSVTYGHRVPRSKTFANLLEKLLSRASGPVDVINAGVSGYTAYNEVQYYLTEGRKFQPDIVIVAFCLNDVANPRLHWNYTQEKIRHIPEIAIPNHDYDVTHALPIMRKEKPRVLPDPSAKVPTYITGEDTISIRVLLDESSPERQWLASMYDRLHQAVEEDGARLIILMVPVAYQLDDDYPFLPQKQLAAYFERKGIPYIDLLPAFAKHPKESIFFLDDSPLGGYDIWHLTGFGHKLTATAIYRFLQANSRLLHRSPEKLGHLQDVVVHPPTALVREAFADAETFGASPSGTRPPHGEPVLPPVCQATSLSF